VNVEQFMPMTEEQRKRWEETRLFPVERWAGGPDSTPLACAMPTNEELRALANSVPEHIQCSGWYLGKPAFGLRYLYADNFRGMGRQWVCNFDGGKGYVGGLAEYVAAVHPRAVLRLLDQIEVMEKELQVLRSMKGAAPSDVLTAKSPERQP
jgi:hypothetical protein